MLIATPIAAKLKMEEPYFIRSLRLTEVTEGEPAKLEAQVAGVPRPEVTWTRDGQPIQADGETGHYGLVYEKDGRVALLIDAAELSDAGSYTCTASNAAGKASKSANLVVNKKKPKGMPPGFLRDLEAKSINYGEKIMLTGRLNPHIKAELSWFKDGAPFNFNDPRVTYTPPDKDGNFMIIIDKVGERDAGRYSCVARNDAGETERAVTVAHRGREMAEERERQRREHPDIEIKTPEPRHLDPFEFTSESQ